MPKTFRILAFACSCLLLGCDNAPAQAPAVTPAVTGKRAWYGEPSPDQQLESDLTRRNYYIVLDGSGSMRDTACGATESKHSLAKKALVKFVAKIPNDNVGLLVFDTRGVTERVSLGITNRVELNREIQAAGADSSTPLKSAIQTAYRHIKLQAQKQLGYGEYHLVIVTDGEASAGEDPTVVVSIITGESPVVLHTIGFCIGAGHSLNQPGRTIYKEASNLKELEKGLDAVLAEADKFVPLTTFRK